MDARERNQTNRSNWDARVPLHLGSRHYAVDEFVKSRESRIGPIERREVGDVDGSRLLHLQCHIGIDTLSWALLGARVTGVDFSEPALDAARTLARRMDIDARFVRADAQTLDLGEEFDVVFASRGVLTWIEDLDAWMRAAARHVAPGGMVYLFDGHPLAECLELDADKPVLSAAFNYFRREPKRCEWPHSYVDSKATLKQPVSYQWTHSIGSIVDSANRAGLEPELVHEFPQDFFQRYPFEAAVGEYWRIPGDPLPLTFSMRARLRRDLPAPETLP